MRIVALLIFVILPFTVGYTAGVPEAEIVSGTPMAFELKKGDGSMTALSDYRGKNVLLAFGFTHCAHICPMIAANMARALKVSDKDAIGIFVSVDTERDTPAIAAAYAGQFGELMLGVSGSHAEVSQAAKNFGVTFVVTKSQDNYTVQHTPSIFLIGPDGEFIDSFAMNTSTAAIAAAMR